MPENIFPSISYTNNKVSFDIKADGENKYEYALSNSPVSPLSGIETKTESITAPGLVPASTYYVYGRSIKNNNFYSQWTADRFTSAVNPVKLPWHISGNPNVYPFWPTDVRVQTPAGHFSNSDGDWNVITDFPNVGDTAIWALSTFFWGGRRLLVIYSRPQPQCR
jgi:hypothetical protein